MDFACRRVGLAERAEQEAEGVAQLAVDLLCQSLEKRQAGDDVFAEVDRGDPQADDVSAELVHDGDGIDEVAEGFAEGAALLVQRPAVGGNLLEGRAVVHSDGAEQRRHEPSAMLVASLGVEVGAGIWIAGDLLHVGVEVEDGVGAGTGLEPNIEDVCLLAELGVAAGAGGAGGSRSSGVRMYQASADSFAKRETMRLLISGLRSGSPHLRQRKTAMGTPQMRWREMHQSGRVATILVMRSCPQAGSHLTVLISSRARWRRVVGGGASEESAVALSRDNPPMSR